MFLSQREGDRKTSPTTHRLEGNASAPVLYMALELSNKPWRVAFGGGGTGRQVSVPAGDLSKLAEAVAKDKERFGMPPSARVVSCYEAGRDGWSVVRMPRIEEEDARRPHRELERLKRERLAQRVRMRRHQTRHLAGKP